MHTHTHMCTCTRLHTHTRVHTHRAYKHGHELTWHLGYPAHNTWGHSSCSLDCLITDHCGLCFQKQKAVCVEQLFVTGQMSENHVIVRHTFNDGIQSNYIMFTADSFFGQPVRQETYFVFNNSH